MKIQLIAGSIIKDISQLVTSITWSGDYQQAARKLEVEILDNPVDPYIPKVSIATGNVLKLLDDAGTELFRGYIFARERSRASLSTKVTAYDGLIYLLKSKATYNFKKLTAEAITAKVAADFGIPAGNLAKTGISQNLLVEGEAVYDIIMKAYSAASRQNGKKYMPLMQQGKLNIIEKGSVTAQYILGSDTNITDSTYTESIENMINRVKIYDDKGNYIGKVENADWIKAYGILQDVYQKEKDKNANTVAKNMLVGIERDGSITALGYVDCITGRAVRIKEPFTGLVGIFYIDTDTHTWQDGQHTMQLSVHFENLMDSKS